MWFFEQRGYVRFWRALYKQSWTPEMILNFVVNIDKSLSRYVCHSSRLNVKLLSLFIEFQKQTSSVIVARANKNRRKKESCLAIKKILHIPEDPRCLKDPWLAWRIPERPKGSFTWRIHERPSRILGLGFPNLPDLDHWTIFISQKNINALLLLKNKNRQCKRDLIEIWRCSWFAAIRLGKWRPTTTCPHRSHCLLLNTRLCHFIHI
jgi:hypothetical protein